MSDSPTCLNARTSLEAIRSLKQEFETAYDLAVSSGEEEDIKRAKELKHDLETKMKALQEILATQEAERLYDLRRQYEAQVTLLKNAGLVTEEGTETDAQGVERKILVMTGIDKKTSPIPSYETIVSRLYEQRDLFRTKADQGFTKLLLVPFGMSLDEIIVKFKVHLLKYNGNNINR
ncbi:MAG: hypothetical protein AAB448_03775, partial [Patescibacteria group bacterium]